MQALDVYKHCISDYTNKDNIASINTLYPKHNIFMVVYICK
jgi:hypothetical protein